MSAVSIVSFAVMLGVVASCFRKGADILSPARVFSFTWALSFGLADMKLSRFQHNWSALGWFELLLGVVSFLVGVFSIYVMYLRSPLLKVKEIRSRLQIQARETLDPRKFLQVLTILFLAYLLAYVAEVAIAGNVPLFAPNPERLRVSFGVFGLHLFVTSMLTILLFTVEYFVFMSPNRRKKLFVAFVFVGTAGTFFMLLQRYSFFNWALIAFGLAYYGSVKFNPKKFIILAAVFFGILILIQSLRSVLYVQNYLYVVSEMKYSREYAAFTEPYMYVAMNLENVARGVDKLEHLSYGYFSFDWVLALTGLKHLVGDYFRIVVHPFLNSDYNTYGFQWGYYRDFGTLGVAFGSLIMGILVGLAYYGLRTSPTILLAYAYSVSLVFMITSFRDAPLSRLDFVSNLFLIWVVHRFWGRKKPASIPAATMIPNTT